MNKEQLQLVTYEQAESALLDGILTILEEKQQ
jgi:hypothetical protein